MGQVRRSAQRLGSRGSIREGRLTVYLRSIRLRDWKAFASATFDFPKPTKAKNVVLIGAKNGFGKTSLLEAIILGLYGRDGMSVLARAVADSSGDSDRSYDEFMQRALHGQAILQ